MIILNVTSKRGIVNITNNILYSIQKDEEMQKFALMLLKIIYLLYVADKTEFCAVKLTGGGKK